jgi:DNA-directed RNA polymerase specialized sigma24 family protein
MSNTEINGVELEELIFKAARRDPQALNDLLYSDWMTRRLEHLADWARWKYNVDGEEVRDFVFDCIRSQAQSPDEEPREPWLDNPHRSSWKSCLNKWTKTATRYRSLSILDHHEVEGRHAAALKHKHTTRIEHGIRIVEPSAHTPSPEEELERKEWASLEEKIDETARQVFHSSTEECQQIALLWAGGMKLREIAAELDSSIQTVNRKLKMFQRAVVEKTRKGIVEEIGEEKTEECGVGRVLGEIVENRADLNDLLPTYAPAAPAPDPAPEPEAPRPRRRRTRRRKTPNVPLAA